MRKHTRRSLLKAMGTVALVPSLKGLGANQSGPPAAKAETQVATAGAGKQPELVDPFMFPGDRNIRDEDHFGIINGLITTGVNYRDIGSLSSLYAPPYASSDFLLEVRLFGEKVPTKRYEWHPTEVPRKGEVHGISVSTTSCLVHGVRGGLLELTLQNTTSEKKKIPIQLNILGSLDYLKVWEFSYPNTTKKTTTAVSEVKRVVRENQAGAIAVGADLEDMRWEPWSSHWEGEVVLLPGQRTTHYVAVAMGDRTDCRRVCNQLLKNPAKEIADSRQASRDETKDLFTKLPKLEASNRSLVEYYNRSIVCFIINKWKVPEFVLNPYYSTGGIKGGCVGEYLWDFGGVPELLPLYDPAATKEHIKQFLKIDITKHFLFNPMDGEAGGPWYPVNQEKIILLIYHYVQATGDVGFLSETVNGKSVLDWVLYNANFGDDLSKPAVLLDYGTGNNHLELRTKYRYDNFYPDLNGRRYKSFQLAWQLGKLSGKNWDYLLERAEALKVLLKETLWSPKDRWFFFMYANGVKELRYTNYIFKMMGSKVLDKEEEQGLVSHLNDDEFLSAYGLHSIAKQDPAYDQVDIDNGGGGNYVAFTPRIAEFLYQAGYTAQAEELLKRTLWWGERMPYWGDSLVANQIEYRKDTPLQNAIDAGAGAQCIIFGMFGVNLELDGTITINPRLPSWSPQASLKGLRLRGSNMDISAAGHEFTVRVGGRVLRSKIGTPVRIRASDLATG
ncbi:MAG: hypothetical protein ABSF14_19195 [Terriglobia bacterium]